MNIEKLFAMQEQLDDRIREEKGLQGVDVTDKKVLALAVELGECINEVPEAMKFWSNKTMNRKKALEEFVDCIHFVLSLGIDKNYNHFADKVLSSANPLEVQRISISTEDVTAHFLKTFAVIQDFSQDKSWENYCVLVDTFLNLGDKLGFSRREIEQAYISKNEENHVRQDTNY